MFLFESFLKKKKNRCEAALAALQQKVEAEDKIVMENIFKAEMNFRKNAGNAIAERNALLSTNPDYFPHCISQITDLTPADASLLQHLKNIKTTYKAEGLKKRVTLVFEQNPLISNTELWIELTGTEQDVTFSGIEFLTSSKSEPKKNLKRSKPVDTPYVFFKSFEKDADEAEVCSPLAVLVYVGSRFRVCTNKSFSFEKTNNNNKIATKTLTG